jgi:Ca2+-binding RTX toxin-like protein
MVESLELRRLLSATLDLVITDGAPQADSKFGSAIATNGSLALVASPFYSDAFGFEGKVSLVDTTSGATLHTWAGGANGAFFGGDVAWVDGKIAIGAEGLDAIFIYDANTYAELDTIANPNGGGSTGFGSSMAVIGDDLLVGNNFGGTGEVLRFDLDVTADLDQLVATFESSDPNLSQLGTAITARSGDIFVAARDGASGVVVKFDALTADEEVVATYATPVTALAVTGNTLFVGNGGANEVYQLNADTGSLVHTYSNPSGLGDSIAVNGGQVVFGAVEVAAYVYDFTTFAFVETLDNPAATGTESNDGDFFADSVAALPGGKYLVADPFDDLDDTTLDSGAVYVFSLAIVPPPSNTPPSGAQIAGQADAVRNQTIDFTGAFTDPDLDDSHTIDWDFGDGNTLTDAGLEVSHAFVTTGTFTVTMTVTDEANATTTATFDVTVTASGVQGGVLYVGGSNDANDTVAIKKSDVGGSAVTLNGQAILYSGSKVVIYGGSGNDTITVSPAATVTIEAYGGAGNDSIAGGSGNDIIIGGDGDDVLYGGAGLDVIIGGIGADGIYGEVNDDILIAPSTVHDADSAALNQIMSIWTNGDLFSDRVATLKAGLLTLGEEVPSLNDGDVDILTGKNGDDWFVYDANEDVATDIKSAESVEALSFVPLV